MTTIEVTTRISDLEAQVIDLNRESAEHSRVISSCLLDASRLGKLDADAYAAAQLGLEKCRIVAQGCNTALENLKAIQGRAARIDKLKLEKLAFIDGLSVLLDFKKDIETFNAKRGNGDRKRDAGFVHAMERVRQFVQASNGMSSRAGELGLQAEHEKALAALGLNQNGVNGLLYNATLASR